MILARNIHSYTTCLVRSGRSALSHPSEDDHMASIRGRRIKSQVSFGIHACDEGNDSQAVPMRVDSARYQQRDITSAAGLIRLRVGLSECKVCSCAARGVPSLVSQDCLGSSNFQA